MNNSPRRTAKMNYLESMLPVGTQFRVWELAKVVGWHSTIVRNNLNRMIERGYNVECLGIVDHELTYVYRGASAK